ncbi:MAG: RNase H family protein [Planctomycetota bacterium]
MATRGRQEARGARAGKKKKVTAESKPAAGTPPSDETAPAGETPKDGAAHVYLKVTASKSLAGWAVGIRGLPKSRVLADGQPGASANLLGILAVCAALDVIPKKQPVVVHVSSDYVRQGATEWLPGWQERNWRTKDKKPVANAEAWQALAERLKGRKVRFEKIQEADIPRRELLESLAKDAAKLRTKAGSG